MDGLHFGRIVRISVDDGHGRRKVRPVVIIDGDERIQDSDELCGVTISSTKDPEEPFYHILVHNTNKRDLRTHLFKPCWAKCNFVVLFKRTQIIDRYGTMPDDLLEKIVETYDQLFMDDNFVDWQ